MPEKVARPSYNRFKRRRFRRMSYEQAKKTVRTLGLTSRDQYLNWHHRERPIWIPRYPNRAFQDEWEGWPEFLGTENVFGGHLNVRDGSKFLPYWEAVRLMQKLAAKYEITTQLEYHRWHKENDGVLDEIDILPRAPQAYYDEWGGWKVWLGKTIEGKLIAAKEATEAVGLLCLARDPSLPQNIATVVRCLDGKSQLIDTLRKHNLQYVRVYKYSEEDERLFWQIIEHFSKEYHGEKAHRMCSMGAAQMLSELDMQLLRADFP